MNVVTKIIGIGGLPRSGKDTLADLLTEKGYYGFSFGDFTRKYTRIRHSDDHDPISVANMTETSNWLREKYGPDVILQEALKEFDKAQSKASNYEGLVLFSIRAPIEVDWILKHGGELVWMETDDKIRYERGLQHLRPGEPKLSFAEFIRQEQLQWRPQPDLPKESQMNISYVKKHATIIVENNGDDVEEFKTEATKVLGLS